MIAGRLENNTRPAPRSPGCRSQALRSARGTCRSGAWESQDRRGASRPAPAGDAGPEI